MTALLDENQSVFLFNLRTNLWSTKKLSHTTLGFLIWIQSSITGWVADPAPQCWLCPTALYAHTHHLKRASFSFVSLHARILNGFVKLHGQLSGPNIDESDSNQASGEPGVQKALLPLPPCLKLAVWDQGSGPWSHVRHPTAGGNGRCLTEEDLSRR